MNITLENFNDYVKIIEALCDNQCFSTASIMAENLYNWFCNLEDVADTENFLIPNVIRMYTGSKWRGCKSDDEYGLLSEDLKVNPMWSDSLYELLDDYTKAYVYSQRGEAYADLVDNWARGSLRDLYVDHAISDMTQAVDLLEELVDKDPGMVEFLDSTKIHTVTILKEKSVKHARDYVIALTQEITTEEWVRLLPGIYEELTSDLFDNMFNLKPMMTVLNHHNVPEKVKEDAFDHLLNISEENDDPYWWMFTHCINLENRQKILIVNDFSEGGDNDFEDIPWVFTIDRLPFGIEFDPGHPIAGLVYVVDPYNPELYHPAD